MAKRNKPSWVALYNKLSHKLLEFKDDRAELVAILKDIDQSGIAIPYLSKKFKDKSLEDIDPFTLYFCLCYEPESDGREFHQAFYKKMGIEDAKNIEYDLFPSFDRTNLKGSLYDKVYGKNSSNSKELIELFWKLFSAAVEYSDCSSEENEANLEKALIDKAKKTQVSTNVISPLLYIINPYVYPFMYDFDCQNYSRTIAKDENKKTEQLSFHIDDLVKSEQSNCDKNKFLADRFINCIKAYKTYFAREDIEINDFTELYALANEIELKSYSGPNPNAQLEAYTPEDFKKEVFIETGEYEKIVSLLKYKKNLCLQGPPGVGKTFMAKRLAYSIMGVKDDAKIKFVQFHQSYSYEDFIMGYRPTENGFEIHNGVFYTFCKEAASDLSHDYFFIIDEINRGNLSKIFGELFMLMENDKRGMSLKLLYKDEEFSIPENLYIIGMMNTADRSLAMMDYALRRRFAFYTVEPNLGDQLIEIIGDNPQLTKLIKKVEKLNDEISEDDLLGPGFQIGHSYFCVSEEQLLDENIASNIVEYELIPLLEEYWYDNKKNLNKWTAELRKPIA